MKPQVPILFCRDSHEKWLSSPWERIFWTDSCSQYKESYEKLPLWLSRYIGNKTNILDKSWAILNEYSNAEISDWYIFLVYEILYIHCTIFQIYLFFEYFKLSKPNECDQNYVDLIEGRRFDMTSKMKHYCGSAADAVTTNGKNLLFFRYYSVKATLKSEFKAYFTSQRDLLTDGGRKLLYINGNFNRISDSSQKYQKLNKSFFFDFNNKNYLKLERW